MAPKIGIPNLGGGCGNKGNNDSSNDSNKDAFALVVKIASIRQHNESGWGEEQDAVMTAATMLSRRGQAVDNTTRGGADDTKRCHQYRDDGNEG